MWSHAHNISESIKSTVGNTRVTPKSVTADRSHIILPTFVATTKTFSISSTLSLSLSLSEQRWARGRDSSWTSARKPKVIALTHWRSNLSLGSVRFDFSVTNSYFASIITTVASFVDLLTKDYTYDQKFTVSTYSDAGVVRNLASFFNHWLHLFVSN